MDSKTIADVFRNYILFFLSSNVLHATKAYSNVIGQYYLNDYEQKAERFQYQNGLLPTDSAFIWRYLFIEIRLTVVEV